MQSYKVILLLIICQCVLTYAQISRKFFRSDYTYFNSTQSFYKVHTLRKPWKEAKETCALEGASLVYPEDGDEAAVVTELFTKSQPTYSWVWINAHMGKEYYETGDGVPLSQYSNWAPSEPWNRHISMCVVLTDEDNFKIDTCTNKNPFICKKTLSSLEWNTLCNIPKQDAQISTEPPNDYTQFDSTKSSYKIHTTQMSWKAAKKICALEGAFLLFPEDENEADVVTEFLRKSEPAIWRVFVGASAHFAKGVYETVDGALVSQKYHRWGPGEPDAGTSQGCVILTRYGNLKDEDCTNNCPFICKKTVKVTSTALDSTPPSITWPNFNMDYEYNKAVGRCYKIHLNPSSWSDAYATCAAEQSYLAIINSDIEADVLANLTASAPTDQVPGNFDKGYVHLGFHDLDGEGWSTTTGIPLNETGYSHWHTGEPNGQGKEKCGSMQLNGQLNDIGCKKKCLFICEHKIEFGAASGSVG